MKKFLNVIKYIFYGLLILGSFLALLTIVLAMLYYTYTTFDLGLHPKFDIHVLKWLVPIALAIMITNILYFIIIWWIYWE